MRGMACGGFSDSGLLFPIIEVSKILRLQLPMSP